MPRAVLGMWSLTDSTGVGTVRQCSAGHKACGGRPRSWFPSSWYLTRSLCWCLETPWHSLFPLNSAGLCGAELHWPYDFPGSFASRETVISGSACSPLWTRPLLKPRGPGTPKCYLSPRNGGQHSRAHSVERQWPSAATGRLWSPCHQAVLIAVTTSAEGPCSCCRATVVDLTSSTSL